MKIYLDTNVAMDIFIGSDRPNYQYSIRILNAIDKTPGLTGLFSVQSLTDIAYSQTKYGQQNRERFYRQAKTLLGILTLVTIAPSITKEALKAQPKDFEDYEQILCAEENGCSWFVTGDENLLKTYGESKEHIAVISPKDFLELASRKR